MTCSAQLTGQGFHGVGDLAIVRREFRMPAFALGLLGPTSISATRHSFDDDYRRMAVVDEAARAAEAADRSSCSRERSNEPSANEWDDQPGSVADSDRSLTPLHPLPLPPSSRTTKSSG